MKNVKNPLIYLVVLTTFLINLIACTESESDETKTGSIKIFMTDSMADYLAVNIDVQSVTLHFANEDSVETDSSDVETESWLSVPTNNGIYNLLDFQNGNDTLIAFGDVPIGKLTQMRLMLGDSSSIITTSDTVALKVPGGFTSGYKILINKNIDEGDTLSLVFDFNAEKSVIKKGNGEYMLKPVLKLME